MFSLNPLVLQAFCTMPLPALFCPKILTITLKAVKRCSDNTGDILVCCAHVYLSFNANQSQWIKVCHGVTSMESLTPSEGEFQGLMPLLFSCSAQVFVCMQIYHLPPEQMLQCISSYINSMSLFPAQSAPYRCIRRGGS